MDGIIHIPQALIHESLDCPICMCLFKDPVITYCGHSYCKSCIEECINRTHDCPHCKAKLEKNQIWRNYKIDQFIQMVEKAKGISQKMIDVKLDENDPLYKGNPEMMESPFIQIARQSIRDSLYKYEKYSEGLKKDTEEMKNKIKLKYALQLSQGINQSNFEQNEEAKRTELNLIDKKYQTSLEFLIDSYQKFLKESLASPEQLPMRISISIQSKNIMIDSMYIKFYDSILDIRSKIEEYFQKKGDPVVKFDPALKCYVDSSLSESPQKVSKMANMNQGDLEGVLIDDETRPLKFYNIKPGSKIQIIGEIKLRSDLPKPCFSLIFVKEAKQLVDYYSCNDCNLSWICENCIKFCHKTHNTKEQLKGHLETWACCYCSKNKVCKLPNKLNSGSVYLK